MQFSCGKCGKSLGASHELVGSFIVCWGCGEPTEVPEPAPKLLQDVSLSSVLAGMRCPYCDYQLQGLVENKCPECGRRFDPLALLRKGTPTHRRQETFAYGFVAGGVAAFVLIVLLCAGL